MHEHWLVEKIKYIAGLLVSSGDLIDDLIEHVDIRYLAKQTDELFAQRLELLQSKLIEDSISHRRRRYNKG